MGSLNLGALGNIDLGGVENTATNIFGQTTDLLGGFGKDALSLAQNNPITGLLKSPVLLIGGCVVLLVLLKK